MGALWQARQVARFVGPDQAAQAIWPPGSTHSQYGALASSSGHTSKWRCKRLSGGSSSPTNRGGSKWWAPSHAHAHASVSMHPLCAQRMACAPAPGALPVGHTPYLASRNLMRGTRACRMYCRLPLVVIPCDTSRLAACRRSCALVCWSRKPCMGGALRQEVCIVQEVCSVLEACSVQEVCSVQEACSVWKCMQHFGSAQHSGGAQRSGSEKRQDACMIKKARSGQEAAKGPGSLQPH